MTTKNTRNETKTTQIGDGRLSHLHPHEWRPNGEQHFLAQINPVSVHEWKESE
jgi:hypothetical protein